MRNFPKASEITCNVTLMTKCVLTGALCNLSEKFFLKKL